MDWNAIIMQQLKEVDKKVNAQTWKDMVADVQKHKDNQPQTWLDQIAKEVGPLKMIKVNQGDNVKFDVIPARTTTPADFNDSSMWGIPMPLVHQKDFGVDFAAAAATSFSSAAHSADEANKGISLMKDAMAKASSQFAKIMREQMQKDLDGYIPYERTERVYFMEVVGSSEPPIMLGKRRRSGANLVEDVALAVAKLFSEHIDGPTSLKEDFNIKIFSQPLTQEEIEERLGPYDKQNGFRRQKTPKKKRGPNGG